MEKIPNIDALAEDSNIEKIEDKKSLLEVLNKARQEHKEQEIYNFVFNGNASSDIDLPDYLKERSDLIDKFAVGFGKPYKSSSAAAHDLMEYLANEGEDAIHVSEDDIEKERIEKEKVRIGGEIDDERKILEKLNRARQDQTEAENLYNYIFGIDTSNPYDLPKYLIGQDDIVANFSYGKAGQKYNSKATAAHDLVEFLYQESEKQINDLENEIVDLSPELRREREEKIRVAENIVPPPPVETIEATEPEIEPVPAISDVVEEEPVERVDENVAIPPIPVNAPTEEVVSPESASTEANVNNLEKRKGILRKIGSLATKYPKLVKLGAYLTLAATLYKATETPNNPKDYVKPDVTYTEGNEPPTEINVSEISIPDNIKSRLPTVYEYVLKYSKSIDKEEFYKEAEESLGNLEVRGFEDYVLSNEQIDQIFKKTLPKGFTHKIKLIEYADHEYDIDKKYGISSKTGSLNDPTGKAAATSFHSKNKIVFYKDPTSSKEWVANQLIGHEVFHFNDWVHSSVLTTKERYDLLSKVIARLDSSDRYKSNYVENINNDDDKTELTLKASEYFAEIGGVYLSSDFDLLPNADKELVRDFIAKIDPDFKRGDALKIRDKIIGHVEFKGVSDNRTDSEREEDWKVEAESGWRQYVELLSTKGIYQGWSPELIKENKEWYINDTIEAFRSMHQKNVKQAEENYQTRLKNRYNNYEK